MARQLARTSRLARAREFGVAPGAGCERKWRRLRSHREAGRSGARSVRTSVEWPRQRLMRRLPAQLAAPAFAGTPAHASRRWSWAEQQVEDSTPTFSAYVNPRTL